MTYEFPNTPRGALGALRQHNDNRSSLARIKGGIIYVFQPASEAIGHPTAEPLDGKRHAV